MTLTFADILFYLMAVLIISCAAIVVFSKNIVHSAFSLLGTFTGVAGLYGLLTANFLAAVQILVYVGGVLIIILFAIMLTRNIQDAKDSNPSSKLIPALLVGTLVCTCLILIALGYPWPVKTITETQSSVPQIGDALLGKYIILFEVLSLLLLAALIGSVMLVRKEIKPEEAKEPRS
jgi:NADH:ubiquinone oxidoreductase subunit 6 (subunit J)